jgi:signal transduction histidine kinase
VDSNSDSVQSARNDADATQRLREGRTPDLLPGGRRTQTAACRAGEFLGRAGHDLRTPLHAITGFARLMLSGTVGSVSNNHRAYLGDILESAHQRRVLLDDLLDVAELESGAMEFRAEPRDPGSVVAEVRDSLSGLAASKRIRVATELDAAVAQVVLDRSKLRQVLYNPLSNALKFAPDDGHVTIRIVHEALDRFRIEVEDTGIGTHREDAARLFVDFRPLDADILILAPTVSATRGDERRAIAAGCDGYVTKPIYVVALPRLIAEHLAARSATP